MTRVSSLMRIGVGVLQSAPAQTVEDLKRELAPKNAEIISLTSRLRLD